jgi:hypothetical protein
MPTTIYATETPWESTTSAPVQNTPWMLWTGRILSGVPALFLTIDAVMKFFKPAVVVEGTVQLGYPESCIVPLGIVLLISTLLYAIPRTAVLGAILLTGYLGGAVATHVRVSDGWFNMLFPVLFGVLLWSGLWLRSARLRSVLPYLGA